MFDASRIQYGFKIAGGIISVRGRAAVGGDFLQQIAETVVGICGGDISRIGHLRDLIERIKRLQRQSVRRIGGLY